jgi:type IV pilus assembly protein PilB
VIDLLSLLQTKGVLDEKEVADIHAEAHASGSAIEELLVRKGVSPGDILAAKGEYWNVPVRTLEGASIPYDILQYIPEESAAHYQVAPLALVDNVLEVGIVDPDNIEALDALNFISTKKGVPFKIFLISHEAWEGVMGMYRGITSQVGEALSALKGDEEEEGSAINLSADKEDQALDDLEQTVQAAGKKGQRVDIHEEAPVTKIVATILRSAIDVRASDIHVEPERDRVRVRFRIDGDLNQSLVLPGKVQRAVVARIKILAGIKLDERRKPQDGRFSATIGGRRVDFRVSTFPVYFGEKVVMRILDSERGNITLEDLGMDPAQLEIVRKAVQAPYGMILITGPTGSGKSTSLYAMLNEVDREKQNVLSLEDPVEYNIAGVSQSQVRAEIGYTFAAGIRSILRQDPDVIMVGEIRDKETAQLAVQAALTGHLVFSTLHTNTATGAVPRLVDMGVDPYLLAPTLQLIVAQRLVRRLCPDSGKPIPIEGGLKRLIDDEFSTLPPQYRHKIPHATELMGIQPSSSCPVGTRGRIGVYEMLELTDELKKMILERADEAAITAVARKNGMMSLKEDAIIKAMRKLIPYEEVAQVGASLDAAIAEEDPVPQEVEHVAEDTPSEVHDASGQDLV